jgi:hypothetical protein
MLFLIAGQNSASAFMAPLKWIRKDVAIMEEASWIISTKKTERNQYMKLLKLFAILLVTVFVVTTITSDLSFNVSYAHGRGNGAANGNGHGYDRGPGKGPGEGQGLGHRQDRGPGPGSGPSSGVGPSTGVGTSSDAATSTDVGTGSGVAQSADPRGDGSADDNDGNFARGFYDSADADNPCANSEMRNLAFCLR